MDVHFHQNVRPVWVDAVLVPVEYETETVPLLFSPETTFYDYFETLIRQNVHIEIQIRKLQQCTVQARRERENGLWRECTASLIQSLRIRQATFSSSDYQLIAGERHCILTLLNFATFFLKECDRIRSRGTVQPAGNAKSVVNKEKQKQSQEELNYLHRACFLFQKIEQLLATSTYLIVEPPTVTTGDQPLAPQAHIDYLFFSLILHNNHAIFFQRRRKHKAAAERRQVAYGLWLKLRAQQWVNKSTNTQNNTIPRELIEVYDQYFSIQRGVSEIWCYRFQDALSFLKLALTQRGTQDTGNRRSHVLEGDGHRNSGEATAAENLMKEKEGEGKNRFEESTQSQRISVAQPLQSVSFTGAPRTAARFSLQLLNCCNENNLTETQQNEAFDAMLNISLNHNVAVAFTCLRQYLHAVPWCTRAMSSYITSKPHTECVAVNSSEYYRAIHAAQKYLESLVQQNSTVDTSCSSSAAKKSDVADDAAIHKINSLYPYRMKKSDHVSADCLRMVRTVNRYYAALFNSDRKPPSACQEGLNSSNNSAEESSMNMTDRRGSLNAVADDSHGTMQSMQQADTASLPACKRRAQSADYRNQQQCTADNNILRGNTRNIEGLSKRGASPGRCHTSLAQVRRSLARREHVRGATAQCVPMRVLPPHKAVRDGDQSDVTGSSVSRSVRACEIKRNTFSSAEALRRYVKSLSYRQLMDEFGLEGPKVPKY